MLMVQNCWIFVTKLLLLQTTDAYVSFSYECAALSTSGEVTAGDIGDTQKGLGGAREIAWR